MLKKIGQWYFVDTTKEYNEIINYAASLNAAKITLEDIEDEKVRKFLKKFTNRSSGLIEIPKKFQLQANAATSACNNKLVAKALQSSKENVVSAVTIALTINSGIYPTQDFVESILKSSGVDYEKDADGPIFYGISETLSRADKTLSLSKTQETVISESIFAGLNNLKVNERYGKNAANNLNKNALKLHKNCVTIAEPKKADFEATKAENPYKGTKLRSDFLMYRDDKKYNFAVGELFSMLSSDYEERMANKIIASAVDFKHLFKAVTTDKADSLEKAQEIIARAMNRCPEYLDSAGTEHQQYEWVALNDLAVGETNLDAIYNLLYMMAERLGMTSIMPKNKYELFIK